MCVAALFSFLLIGLVHSQSLTVKVCVPYALDSIKSFLDDCTDAIGIANTEELEFVCVEGGSADECIDQIVNGTAHLTTLDGSDVIRANDVYGIQPLLVEKTGEDVSEGEYYAVAVVHKEFCTPTTILADLEGKRSCHTGFRKSAGWKIPVGTLITNVDTFHELSLDPNVEDDAELVAEFFETVCAPRIAENGPMNTENGTGALWEPLCTGCKGDCSTNDQYYDYSGAFRCLVEDYGDVAFVKHTTVLDYAFDGVLDPVMHAWDQNKTMDDFRLLCLEGGCALVNEFEDCHLGVAPGHALVTSKELGYEGEDSETGLAIQAAILDAVENPKFLESTTELTTNFIWSQATTGIVSIEKGMDEYLSESSRDVYLAFDAVAYSDKPKVPPNAFLCATSKEENALCEKMIKIANDLLPEFQWGCTLTNSTFECFEAIQDGSANWMTVGPLEGFFAYVDHDLIPIIAENGFSGNGYDYYSVAVVKKEFCDENEDARLLDLKGKNSCLAGFGRNAGWDLPIGRMIASGIMEPVRDDPDVDNGAETAAVFFNKICAPTEYGTGPLIGSDGENGVWLPLCSGCKDSCEEDSKYFGYEGAHLCLKEGSGDVAFVRHSTIFEYDDAKEREDLRLLCPTESGCKSVDDFEECNLGRVPARSVVVEDSIIYTKNLKEALLKLVEDDDFADLVLNEKNNPDELIFRAATGFVELNDTKSFYGDTFESYEALHALEAPNGAVVKICVPYDLNEGDLKRCHQIFAAANVEDVAFECVSGSDAESCMIQMYKGEAHLTTLDGGDVFRGYKLYGLVPIIKEAGEGGVQGTYFAVAVVNKDFCKGNETLADLENMRSCHTGYRRMAGWRVPIGTLLAEVESFNASTSKETVEDDAELAAKFFSSICAPRVSGGGPQNTDNGEGALWDPLCTGCKGNCEENDQFYDYSGAFRCLMEGFGDVAFVKHTTVLEYASDGSADPVFRAWSKKNMSEYRLLCRTGGCDSVENYGDCYLALVPSHSMVVSPALGKDGQDSYLGRVIRDGLLKAAEDPKFFDAARGFVNDFPFSRSAQTLIGLKNGYEDYITSTAEKTLETFEELIEGEKRANPGNLAIFCAYNARQNDHCLQNVENLYRKMYPGYEWDCIQMPTPEDCILSLEKGISQFMAANPGTAKHAYDEHRIVAIAGEAIGPSKQTTVYSLAVVNEQSCQEKIYMTDLKGEDACFPYLEDTSGWRTPVSVMISEGILEEPEKVTEEDRVSQSVSDFFGKICAPQDTQSGNVSKTFCEACQDKCDIQQEFSGVIGSVECMKQKENAVAFTDDTLLLKQNETEDLQLLCPFKQGCYNLTSYATCNFGGTPTDMILVHRDSSSAYVSNLRSILIEASQTEGYKSLLPTTRDEGKLVSIFGDTDLHLIRYYDTISTLDRFNSKSDR